MTAEKYENSERILKWSLIIAGAGFALVADYLFPGWGRPLLLTILIFGSLLGFCRPYWGTAFWVTAAIAFTFHVGAMLRFRSAINAFSLSELFLGAVAEIILLAILLSFAFPNRRNRR